MAIRARTAVVVVVVGVVAVALAAVLSVRPALDDARSTVDRSWESLRPVLDERYGRLAAFRDAVRAVRADHDLLDEVDAALAGWERATRGQPDPETGAPAASRAESVGTRLAVAVAASPRLVQDPGVAEGLRGFVTHDVSVPLQAYNEAVRRYDSARARFPGAFFAGLLGYDPLPTVEVPGALAEVELPAPPPPDEPPPGEPPPGEPGQDETGGALPE